MLKKLLKLYVTAMTGKVYSPVPHLFGPPGCGKSEVVKQAAQVLGVNLHIINVSRISPLPPDFDCCIQCPSPAGSDLVVNVAIGVARDYSICGNINIVCYTLQVSLHSHTVGGTVRRQTQLAKSS